MLNGPPGVGKSTLARRYVEDHPLTLGLDVDRIRDLIGGWRTDRDAAGVLARAAALGAARAHLTGGYSVIVPQFLARPQLLDQAAELAAAVGAAFHELVLWDGREAAVRRFVARDRTAPGAADSWASVTAAGGTPALQAMYDRLAALVAARPGARLVPTRHGDVEGAYRALLAALEPTGARLGGCAPES
jgi:predicted kinase